MLWHLYYFTCLCVCMYVRVSVFLMRYIFFFFSFRFSVSFFSFRFISFRFVSFFFFLFFSSNIWSTHLDSDSEVFRWFGERVRRKTRPLPVELQLHVDIALGLAGLVRVRETCRRFQFQRRQLAAPVLFPPCHSGRSGFLQQAQRLYRLPRARIFAQPIAGPRPPRLTRRRSPRIRMHPGFRELHHGAQYPRHSTVHPYVGRCSLIPANQGRESEGIIGLDNRFPIYSVEIVFEWRRNVTFASRASGKSSSQKLVTARLMYLIRACGTAHLEGARETRGCEKRDALVAAWMTF